MVTTTVIEVGVHVENACFMVIEGAERFGLSQLHQLRDASAESACRPTAFCSRAREPGKPTQNSALTKTSDGFEIARQDLMLRGPGDFIGVRQHGDAGLMMLGVVLDVQTLELAGRAAREIVSTPNEGERKLVELANERYDAMSDIAMN